MASDTKVDAYLRFALGTESGSKYCPMERRRWRSIKWMIRRDLALAPPGHLCGRPHTETLLRESALPTNRSTDDDLIIRGSFGILYDLGNSCHRRRLLRFISVSQRTIRVQCAVFFCTTYSHNQSDGHQRAVLGFRSAFEGALFDGVERFSGTRARFAARAFRQLMLATREGGYC